MRFAIVWAYMVAPPWIRALKWKDTNTLYLTTFLCSLGVSAKHGLEARALSATKPEASSIHVAEAYERRMFYAGFVSVTMPSLGQ